MPDHPPLAEIATVRKATAPRMLLAELTPAEQAAHLMELFKTLTSEWTHLDAQANRLWGLAITALLATGWFGAQLSASFVTPAILSTTILGFAAAWYLHSVGKHGAGSSVASCASSRSWATTMAALWRKKK